MALLRIATVLSALCHSGAHDYIIVGAGSAWLQMGLFMERAGASYMIYERGEQAGSFWKTYPVTEELISVNSNDPSERYDWHTLLKSPVSFRNFSTRFFPLRSEFRNSFDATKLQMRALQRPCTQILLYQSCYSFEKMSQAFSEIQSSMFESKLRRSDSSA